MIGSRIFYTSAYLVPIIVVNVTKNDGEQAPFLSPLRNLVRCTGYWVAGCLRFERDRHSNPCRKGCLLPTGFFILSVFIRKLWLSWKPARLSIFDFAKHSTLGRLLEGQRAKWPVHFQSGDLPATQYPVHFPFCQTNQR